MQTTAAVSLPETFPSEAERLAAAGQTQHLFSRINLLGIRHDLKELLRHIGTNGIFAQYTRHDISHIDILLNMLNWVVVPSARDSMTAADWMMIVLAVYFHDAGMVVTQAEFDARDLSDFPRFRTSILNSSEATAYKEKIEALEPSERERFLYQEFVRTYHADRISRWILGDSSNELGAAPEARSVIQSMVGGLDSNFRIDLALVCASHHKDDLANLEKYDPRKTYGSAPHEVVNVQFSAILLRTVDLLHVTRDRTPSVAFKLATPSDPKSIEEWAKQISTVSVTNSPARDDSGNVDPSGLSNTVAVSGTFTDPLGFFALTEYLFYAEQQLKESYQWAGLTNTKEHLNFVFPWRKIDTSKVKAVGFESKQFAFELDKPKILKLLTGHTLYSNSNVVVRELIQNSLDATRLQSSKDSLSGKIAIHYDTSKRLLTIDDTGTGMTQRVIEDHFLNVGSSRYQDKEFRKKYPHFAAISRFGIGILSTFMISDEIEVLTRDASEATARSISIRSINGQYLIRILDPNDSCIPNVMRKHGTRVQLKLRPGTPAPDVKSVTEFWILFPACELTVAVDSESPKPVGYKSAKEALEKALTRAGLTTTQEIQPTQGNVYRVVSRAENGLELAIALEWQPTFRNWSFVTVDRLTNDVVKEPNDHVLATCVQGIRVESYSPGFQDTTLVAISNCVGMGAPATNVARSSIEAGSAAEAMLRQVYAFYAEHITSEINAMREQRGFSLSESASEGRYLLARLPQPESLSDDLMEHAEFFKESLMNVPWLTIDKEDKRTLASIQDLQLIGGFWTVESSVYASAESFLRRMPSAVSIAKLMTLSQATVHMPEGEIVSGHIDNSRIARLVASRFEVDRIDIREGERQLDLHWTAVKKDSRWRTVVPKPIEIAARVEKILEQLPQILPQGSRLFKLQKSLDVVIEGQGAWCGCQSFTEGYLFSGNDLHAFINEQLSAVENGKEPLANYILTLAVVSWLLRADEIASVQVRTRVLNHYQQSINQHLNLTAEITADFRELVSNFDARMFNPMRGDRQQQYWMSF